MRKFYKLINLNINSYEISLSCKNQIDIFLNSSFLHLHILFCLIQINNQSGSLHFGKSLFGKILIETYEAGRRADHSNCHRCKLSAPKPALRKSWWKKEQTKKSEIKIMQLTYVTVELEQTQRCGMQICVTRARRKCSVDTINIKPVTFTHSITFTPLTCGKVDAAWTRSNDKRTILIISIFSFAKSLFSVSISSFSILSTFCRWSRIMYTSRSVLGRDKREKKNQNNRELIHLV